MAAAQQIRAIDERVQIMFITHAARYAVRSYEVQAADYILKPLSYPIFSLKMQKLIRTLGRHNGKQLLLQGPKVIRRITSEDVYYIEVEHNSLVYHTRQGIFTCRGTLRNLEETLRDVHFVRCNSCYLVNLVWFEEIRGDIVVVHGEELKVSRNRRKEFLHAVLTFHEGG